MLSEYKYKYAVGDIFTQRGKEGTVIDRDLGMYTLEWQTDRSTYLERITEEFLEMWSSLKEKGK